MRVRDAVLLLSLVLAWPALADPPGDGMTMADDVESATSRSATTPEDAEAPGQEASGPPAGGLPAMGYASSVAKDKILQILKRNPALAGIDEELAGSPLTLLVTHTLRPTSGGQAAGFLSGVLAGSTLGLIPVVSSEMLVLRYEVLLNGKPVASYSFERTATRAMNMWSAGRDDGYEGLGKAGMEWVESTAAEAAARLAGDPALDAVRREIEYYFPPGA